MIISHRFDIDAPGDLIVNKHLNVMSRKRRVRKLKLLAGAIGLVCVLVAAFAFGLRWYNHVAYTSRSYRSVADVPVEAASPRIAIVFGAGLWGPGGKPSPVLYDRIATAADLYRAGKVRKLLLTGDNRFLNYNEPAAMRQAALEMGIPDHDLVLDYAGRHTYDSCYRAREIFGVRRAILVTQSFHLDRALYICNSLGVDSIGITADRQPYGDSHFWWVLREVAATLGAWSNLHLFHPKPVLGEKIPIGEPAKTEVSGATPGG